MVYLNMKHSNMLGKDGLTVTSANHVANIAKEMYEAAESRLKTLKLYSRDYMLAVNGNTYRVENESEKSELETLPSVLKEVGELKSLIAFLREGIKAKEAMGRDEAFEAHVDSLIREGRTDLVKPVPEAAATFEDEFAALTAEQIGCTPGAAATLLCRARKALARELGRKFLSEYGLCA